MGWGYGTYIAGSIIGFSFLAGFLKQDSKSALLLAPSFGIAMSVLILYWAGIFWGVTEGLKALFFVTAISLFIAIRRQGIRLISLSTLTTLVFSPLLVIIPFTLLASPTQQLTSNNQWVHPSNNHDSFYYVSNAEWLREHSLLDKPDVSTDIQNDNAEIHNAPALDSMNHHLSRGESLVQASVSILTGSEVSKFWIYLEFGWLFFIPSALFSFVAQSERRMRISECLLPILICSSSLLAIQIWNQNSPAVLAISLTPFLLVSLFRAKPDSPFQNHLIAVSSVGAMACIYSEILLLLGPLILGSLILQKELLLKKTKRILFFLVGIILIAPVASINSILRFSTLVTWVNAPNPPAFWNVNGWVILARALGLDGIHESGWPAVQVSLFLIALSLILRKRILKSTIGPILLLFLLTSVSIWTLAGYRGAFYSLDRAVQWSQPIFFTLLALFLLESYPKPINQRSKRDICLYGVCLLTVSGMLFLNLRSSETNLTNLPPPDSRSISSDLQQAARWVLDRESTSNTSILLSSYVDRMWMPYELRSSKNTRYLFLAKEYFLVTNTDDGVIPDYMLLSSSYAGRISQENIVEQNDEFILLDTKKEDGFFIAPITGITVSAEVQKNARDWKFENHAGLIIVNLSRFPRKIECGDLGPDKTKVINVNSETLNSGERFLTKPVSVNGNSITRFSLEFSEQKTLLMSCNAR